MSTTPKDSIVLGAIRAGIDRFEKIQKIRHVEPEELDSILERLENNGLIKVEEKKGFLGTKIKITVTKKGSKEINDQVHTVQARWDQMYASYKTQDKTELKKHIDENKSFLPMMIFFGIADMALFSMMSGMIGMTISDFVPSKNMPEEWDESTFNEEFDVGI